MKIGFSTGFAELGNFWQRWPFDHKQVGGSENIVVELASAFAMLGHNVTVRLPYVLGPAGAWKNSSASRWPTIYRGVEYIGSDHETIKCHTLFCVDDYAPVDSADKTVLVACRSDPPRHLNYDQRTYLSATHARLMGDPDAPHIGGGVWNVRYADDVPRVPNRVIYTSSPDRGGHHAAIIGRDFDFVATYRGCNELSGDDLRKLQQGAMAQIHPYDSPRESEFFCMSALEALAAGTPTILADGPALVELWGEAAIILPRPIDYGEWSLAITELLEDKAKWADFSARGKRLAEQYDWLNVASKYLAL